MSSRTALLRDDSLSLSDDALRLSREFRDKVTLQTAALNNPVYITRQQLEKAVAIAKELVAKADESQKVDALDYLKTVEDAFKRTNDLWRKLRRPIEEWEDKSETRCLGSSCKCKE